MIKRVIFGLTLFVGVVACAVKTPNRFVVISFKSVDQTYCKYSAIRDNDEEFIAPIVFTDSCGKYGIGDIVKLR